MRSDASLATESYRHSFHGPNSWRRNKESNVFPFFLLLQRTKFDFALQNSWSGNNGKMTASPTSNADGTGAMASTFHFPVMCLYHFFVIHDKKRHVYESPHSYDTERDVIKDSSTSLKYVDVCSFASVLYRTSRRGPDAR
jgi:hypothetical protein